MVGRAVIGEHDLPVAECLNLDRAERLAEMRLGVEGGDDDADTRHDSGAEILAAGLRTVALTMSRERHDEIAADQAVVDPIAQP